MDILPLVLGVIVGLALNILMIEAVLWAVRRSRSSGSKARPDGDQSNGA